MKFSRQNTYRAIAALFGVFTISTAALFIHAKIVQSRAERFIVDFRELALGSPVHPAVERLAAEHGGIIEGEDPASTCRSDCIYGFRFANQALFQTGLVPEASVYGRIAIEGGSVHWKQLWFGSLGSRDYGAVGVAEKASYPEFDIQEWTKIFRREIYINSNTPDKTKREAYDFHIACLASPFGCRDLRTVLPKAFSATPSPRTPHY